MGNQSSTEGGTTDGPLARFIARKVDPTLPMDTYTFESLGLDPNEHTFIGVTSNGNIAGVPKSCASDILVEPAELVTTPTPSLPGATPAAPASRRVRLRIAGTDNFLAASCRNQAEFTSVRIISSRDAPLPPAATFELRVDATNPIKNSILRTVGAAVLAKLDPFVSQFAPSRDPPPSLISHSHIVEFNEVGCVVLRGVVTGDILADAAALMQRGVDQGIDRTSQAGIHQQWPEEWRKAPCLRRMWDETPLMRSAEAIIGSRLIMPNEAQLAARRKQPGGAKDFGSGQARWHIDAFDPSTAARFAVLVNVALSDWTMDNMGNLAVLDGSHAIMAREMAARPYGDFMAWSLIQMATGDLNCKRRQLHLHAGDVILAHPMLAHDVVPNLCDRVRLAAIFRPAAVGLLGRDALLAGHRMDDVLAPKVHV